MKCSHSCTYLKPSGIAACALCELRATQRALRWAAQWCPSLRDSQCSPMPTKAVQRLIYGYTVSGGTVKNGA